MYEVAVDVGVRGERRLRQRAAATGCRMDASIIAYSIVSQSYVCIPVEGGGGDMRRAPQAIIWIRPPDLIKQRAESGRPLPG